ncbi:ERB1 protein, partial [Fregetta grallaria]|nr:ERB1 protein [Fregetta grallaria]
DYRSAGGYCTGAVGAETKGARLPIWNNRTAKAIPPGYFLICGDRAWQVVPANAVGGPWYFGKLIMFTPSLRLLKGNTTRAKRSLQQLTPLCNGNVTPWGTAERVLASLFAPQVASAQALAQLNKLACWSAKQMNLTSSMLTELLQDMDSLRHAVLQNRAAIDFLLLAHGHGCEEFKGMCCMNLTDHSNSIHKQLAELRKNVQAIKVENGLTDWLQSLGITGWLKDLFLHGITVLIVIIIFLMMLGS